MKKFLIIVAVSLFSAVSFGADNVNVGIANGFGIAMLNVQLNKGILDVRCEKQSQEVIDLFGDVNRINGASNTYFYGYIVSASKLQMTYGISGDNSEVIKNIKIPLNEDCSVTEQ